LDIARGIGANYTEAESLNGMAAAYLRGGDVDRAADTALAALGIARQSEYLMLEGQTLTVLAEIREAQHRHDEADRHAQAALRIHTETGHQPGIDRARALLRADHAAG
jgi:tetratricopeptide (TPR) repeat protein